MARVPPSGAGRRWPAVALAAAALLAAGCSGGEQETQVVVPDVVGLTPDAAVTRLCAAGLVPNVVAVVDPSLPEARPRAALSSAVRATQPAAGARVPTGVRVQLSVAVPGNAAIAFRTAC